MFFVYYRFLLSHFTLKVLCCGGVTMSTFHDVKRLHVHLTDHLETDIRPIINQSETIHVDLLPGLITLHGLDEKKQVLSSTFAMRLTWKSETLTWNSSEFGGEESVKLSSCSVWTPDITYSNDVRENRDLNKCTDKKVTVTKKGMASWNTGSDLQTACNVDIRKYPFDTQTCKIVLGKIIYLDTQQKVNSVTNKLDLMLTDENNEWLIADTYIQNIKRRKTLTYIEIYIVLERRYLFYVLNVIIPVVMLSMMNVFSFKLPSSSGERIGYNISLLLTYVVLLNMISDSVPRVSKYVSYLQLYIVIQFTMAIMISILSITVVRMENDKYKTKMPQFVTKLFKTFLKRQQEVKMEAEFNKGHDEGKQMEGYKECHVKGKIEEMMGGEHNEDPTMIQFLDNLCFWLFMCFFVISTTVCLLAMIL